MDTVLGACACAASDKWVVNKRFNQWSIAFESDSVERMVVPGMGKRAPIVLGKKDFGEISPEEMGAVIGFAKPERSAKILKDKISYETALHQYNKAIQTSAKPAGLIIDALRLDYQNEEVGQFAKHLWKLYHLQKT